MNVSKFVGLFLFVSAWSITSCKPDAETIYVDQETVTPYQLKIPQGFFPMPIPEDNPMTVQGIELGRKLFYDTRLSGDNTQACASCHLASSAFSDPNRFSTGIDGLQGDRNAMALVNLGWSYDSFFWDGRAKSLEEQVLEPINNPIEMNTTWPEVLDKLNADAFYRNKFKIAFDVDVIDSLDVAKAISQFERTLISGNSKFDRIRTQEESYTASEQRGANIFFNEKGDCFHCHGTQMTMGFKDGNNGLQNTIVDAGVGGANGNPNDIGKFKAPTLRNIELSGPYMHDGRFETLEEVIEFYNSGVNVNSPNIDPIMTKNDTEGKRNFNQQDKDDLKAFLLTLTDLEFINRSEFQDPN